jgi:hypothetical protein
MKQICSSFNINFILLEAFNKIKRPIQLNIRIFQMKDEKVSIITNKFTYHGVN